MRPRRIKTAPQQLQHDLDEIIKDFPEIKGWIDSSKPFHITRWFNSKGWLTTLKVSGQGEMVHSRKASFTVSFGK